MTEFSRRTLEARLREMAFLNSGISIHLEDKRKDEPWAKTMSYEGGLEEFVKHIDQTRKSLMDLPISFSGKKDEIEVDVSMWWNDSYYETVNCFTNNIPQKDADRKSVV